MTLSPTGGRGRAEPRRPRCAPRARRRGVTLIEIVVVLAIMALVLAVAIPGLSGILDLKQRGAARDLASTYRFLVQEAAMRNVTFRIAYDLEANSYSIEMGDPDTLVFSSPRARQDYEEAQERKLKLFSKPGKDGAPEESATAARFAGLDMDGFESKVLLPEGTVWGFVYTPQYDGPQVPKPREHEDDPPQVVYSYVFANGEAEYTVVRVVDADDPEDGFSVEVEPVSGNVRVDAELIEVGASLAWLPAEAPTIR